MRWLSVLALVALLALWSAHRPVDALACRCTDMKRCGFSPFCMTSDSAACLAMFVHNGTHHVRRALVCSDAGEECPRGDSQQQATPGGGLTLCCKTDLCNLDLKPPVVRTTAPVAVTQPPPPVPLSAAPPLPRNPDPVPFLSIPPPAIGKLRCDCSSAHAQSCVRDKGARALQHCTVHGGWCATIARPNFIPGLPPSYSRFCTRDRQLCTSGKGSDRSVLCCSNAKFCNQELNPILHSSTALVGSTRSVPGMTKTPGGTLSSADPATAVNQPVQTSGTAQQPVSSAELATTTPDGASTTVSTELPNPDSPGDVNGMTWCHCNAPHQCNTTFPFCLTRGQCQSEPSAIQIFEPKRSCVDKSQLFTCSAGKPCCQGHCCNGNSPCTPLQSMTATRDTPTLDPGQVHTCHCHNCYKAHKCRSEHGCYFEYDMHTGKAHQNCLKDEIASHLKCSPRFALAKHMLNHTFSLGDTHVHCCRGDLCNEKHPRFPAVLGPRLSPCRCSKPHCGDTYKFCVTDINSGVCYRGEEGQFCIHGKETARKERLCANATSSCCTTGWCNEIAPPPSPFSGTDDMSTATNLPDTGVTSSSAPSSDASRVTTRYDVLYIGAASAGFLLVCLTLLIVIFLCRRHAKKHNAGEQQRRHKRPHHRYQPRPVEFPKSTFDTNPVMRQLSAWQQLQDQRLPPLDDVGEGEEGLHGRQSSHQVRTFSMVSATLSDSADSSGKASPSTVNTSTSADGKSASSGSPPQKTTAVPLSAPAVVEKFPDVGNSAAASTSPRSTEETFDTEL